MIYIVLPAFNEKKNLIQVFKKINKLKVKSKVTVILVDDCSNDGTHLLKNSKNNFKLIYIKNTINLGLSLTLKTGFKKIIKKLKKNDLVITLDSDNTHPIEIIPKMINYLIKNNYEIVIASRFLKYSKVNGLGIFRKSLSYFARIIFSITFPHKNLRDYTCNYRIYRSKLIIRLLKKRSFFNNEGFNIAVKILLYLIQLFNNLKIGEYPLVLNYHYKIGESKMKIYTTIFLTLKLIFTKKLINR